MRTKVVLLCIVLSSFLGCKGPNYYSRLIIEPVTEENNIEKVQTEIDDIFSLLIYSLTYKDWQTDKVPRRERRGYNIGALIVNPENEPVFFELNCINSTDNATQHGEVRAITKYLEKTRIFNLKNYSIYTTLEPCVMCAGMMTMVAVKRIVFGQNDVAYSKAFERLAIDTRPIGGFEPYPRRVEAQASELDFRKELDTAYLNFLEVDEDKVLAKFLASDVAKEIFSKATEAFLSYEVKNEANTAIYQAAFEFYERN